MQNHTAIIIPARLSSVRLPNKPLALIHGKPMILWVVEQALKAKVFDVYIACCDKELCDLLKKHNYNYVMTDPDLPSGTDRVYAAYETLKKDYNYIINLQGDLPFISYKTILATHDALISSKGCDISTAVVKVSDKVKVNNPNVVKAVISYQQQALYFSRVNCSYSNNNIYQHIGIYCYTHDALKKFVSLEQSPLEKLEKLEQLRAIENGMKINVAIVDNVPLSVDTPEDLIAAQNQKD